jgi:hypothetical protein
MQTSDWRPPFRTSQWKRIILNLIGSVSAAMWADSIYFGVFVWCTVVVFDELFLIVGESIRLWAGVRTPERAE